MFCFREVVHYMYMFACGSTKLSEENRRCILPCGTTIVFIHAIAIWTRVSAEKAVECTVCPAGVERRRRRRRQPILTTSLRLSNGRRQTSTAVAPDGQPGRSLPPPRLSPGNALPPQHQQLTRLSDPIQSQQ